MFHFLEQGPLVAKRCKRKGPSGKSGRHAHEKNYAFIINRRQRAVFRYPFLIVDTKILLFVSTEVRIMMMGR